MNSIMKYEETIYVSYLYEYLISGRQGYLLHMYFLLIHDY
jgi:hypothetical protein